MDPEQLGFARALADGTRLEIMRQLRSGWLSVGDLVGRLGGRVNQPTVSHHLRVLEESGLVLVRREGRFRYYVLNQERVTLCCGSLMLTFAPDLLEEEPASP
ncbi:MAG: metalloregulator ArsR/SmtB family transcription factor [Anaerolineales bacterium]|jgi:DNA-binding transcriptional ArsR family regulator